MMNGVTKWERDMFTLWSSQHLPCFCSYLLCVQRYFSTFENIIWWIQFVTWEVSWKWQLCPASQRDDSSQEAVISRGPP